MNTAVVIRPSDIEPVDRGQGVTTRYLITRAIGSREFLSGITEFDPNASLPMHSHNCEESVTILSGVAIFETQHAKVKLRRGDTTWVPAQVVHRFLNQTPNRLRIQWTYGSVNATRTLADTGESFEIGSPKDMSTAPGGFDPL